ncbi:MAG TPA: sulfite exporter TauE/SafE family protein [Acidimicrobiales bacterium]|nr:sulfite exporter TauE/SafE family protein [Acidimicrobiales bacterium]
MTLRSRQAEQLTAPMRLRANGRRRIIAGATLRSRQAEQLTTPMRLRANGRRRIIAGANEMEPGWLRDVLALLLGVGTGVLSGAFGVGGAILSTPGIRLLGVPPLIAVGTTLPAVLPSAISGGLRYQREGLINWRAVALTVPVGVLAALGGAVAAPAVPGQGHVLQIMTAALLALSAWRIGRRSRSAGGEEKSALSSDGDDEEEGAPPRPGPGRYAGVGVVAGGLSGLLGIGGGLVLVPGLNQVGKLPLRTSVATSLVCVGAFAVPGTLAHGLLGNIDWRVALLLAVTVIPGARVGAGASLRLRDRRLAQLVAAFLGVISVGYAGGELLALLRSVD